jgi:hypothetical protein
VLSGLQVVQQVGFVGLQLFCEGKLYSRQLLLLSIISIMLKHAFYLRVENDSTFVKLEQDPELLNQVDLGSPGFSGFSGLSAEVEEPESAQVEGKPRMHLTLP